MKNLFFIGIAVVILGCGSERDWETKKEKKTAALPVTIQILGAKEGQAFLPDPSQVILSSENGVKGEGRVFFQTVLDLKERSSSSLFLVCLEPDEGNLIRQAHYESLQINEDNHEIQKEGRGLLRYDRESALWYLPLSELTEVDVQASELYRVTLDLEGEKFGRKFVEVFLRFQGKKRESPKPRELTLEERLIRHITGK